jgi:uncharacterized SAM-binding protein YcdF (DUF218 family)
MNFSLKNAHNRRLAAAALATFTLLNPTLIFGVYNLGTLVLAGLTLLLWVHYFAQKGYGPRWLGPTAKWLCRLGWAVFLTGAAVMYGLTLVNTPPGGAAPCVIVVPGAQVKGENPSLMLQNRLDRGLEIWQEHPGSLFVVSGGKAEGAPLSEAEVMTLYLTQNWVAPEDIFVESKATSTRENFAFSAEIIEAKELKLPVVIATDAFHQTRCRLWASHYGLQDAASAICTPCWGIAPVFWLREVCGVAHYFVFCR